MSRLPIRVRLTAAFALAVVVVIAGAGLFVYLRHQADLDDAVDDSLAKRADAIALPEGRPAAGLRALAGAPADREDGFSQVLDGAGRVIDSSRGHHEPILTPQEVEGTARGTVLTEHRVPGVDGTSRILAREAGTAGEPVVVAVGQSLEDRDEALSNLVASFTIGGPVAVIVASLLGYALATAGLAPIEAIRRRAGEISLAQADAMLPLPAAHDEVRRMGETLNEMLARLRASFERERRFVADASHELRTPIAVLKAELEAALRSGELGPGARESVVAGVEECDSLAALAEDLLVLARGAEGKLPVHRETTPVGELFAGVRDRFADRAAERGRELRIEASDELLVSADALRMRQALGNLVDNALRHGAGAIELRGRAVADGVELEVRDEGAGFEQGVADVAFERFTRGDAARTRGGSGLGLAIVRAVVQAHGGTAEIATGARGVRIWLPATPAGQS